MFELNQVYNISDRSFIKSTQDECLLLDGRGLTRDSCERKNYLEYCDKTYALERRCRYKPWAWAIIIGVPVLGVVLLSAIICVCLKGRGSSA